MTITRAKNELYLIYPLMRAGYGKHRHHHAATLAVLEEIPKDYVDEWNLRTYE